MTTKPYFWIQTLSDALTETKQIPLWGTAPPFPWDECIEDLKEKFACETFLISTENVGPRQPSALLEGMGASPLVTPINATPLEGTFFFAMSIEDAKRVTAQLLTKSKLEKGFTDDRFVTGFYNYLGLEVLETLHEINPFNDLSFTVAEKSKLPEETSLCIDVKIVFDGTPLWGRIICPPSFQGAFKTHFAGEKFDITSQKISSSIDLTLTMEVGTASLKFEEWQSLSVGDLVILDHCLFDPILHKGTLEVVLGNTPLFQARLKEGTLKILDYAYFSEEKKFMDENESSEEKEQPKKPMNEEGELPPEELMGEEGELPPEELMGEEGELPPDEVMEGGEEPEHMWAEEKNKTPLEEMISASEVPVSLTVEVGRLQMSLEKLLEIEPGNTLELTTRVEDGVSVTMHGKCVAHAELVKIGDVLGIKILKIGH